MDLKKDLENIQSIDREHFNKLCTLLNNKSKDEEWAVSLAKLEKITGEERLQSLLRFFNFLSDNLVGARDYQEKFSRIDAVISGVIEGEDAASSGWDLIKASLKEMDAYFQIKKEDRLKDRFARITKFQVTTDVRPVLNINKDAIVKNLLTNILKIETTNDDVFICEFYDDEIDDIIAELERTRKKIELFRETYG